MFTLTPLMKKYIYTHCPYKKHNHNHNDFFCSYRLTNSRWTVKYCFSGIHCCIIERKLMTGKMSRFMSNYKGHFMFIVHAYVSLTTYMLSFNTLLTLHVAIILCRNMEISVMLLNFMALLGTPLS